MLLRERRCGSRLPVQACLATVRDVADGVASVSHSRSAGADGGAEGVRDAAVAVAARKSRARGAVRVKSVDGGMPVQQAESVRVN